MAELDSPLVLGDLHLKNRVVMAPLTRSRASDDRVPTPMMAEYYAQRASAGLILSEATVISEEANGYLNTPGLFTDAQVQGWKLVTRCRACQRWFDCGATVACRSCFTSRFTQWCNTSIGKCGTTSGLCQFVTS